MTPDECTLVDEDDATEFVAARDPDAVEEFKEAL